MVPIAALAEVHDLIAVALDPVCLGREDQGALALARELPCREQSEVRVLAWIGLLLLPERWFFRDEFVKEGAIVV